MPKTALSILAGLSLHLASCADVVGSRVESRLAEAMPRVVGPADRYEVTVRGARSDASRFDAIRIVGVRVQRAEAPVIDRFEIDLRDVTVDLAARSVTAVGAARATARITAADLAGYLALQKWIGGPTVRLLPPDRVSISGMLTLQALPALGPLRATVEGRLVADGPRVRVTVDALGIGDRQAPSVLRALVGAALNPVLDLSSYAVPTTIDAVIVASDAIAIEASGSDMRVVTP